MGVAMKNISDSRVRYLRLALQEAVRVGDKEAAKRLTKRLAMLLAPTSERATA
jgi:hypothetical protein